MMKSLLIAMMLSMAFMVQCFEPAEWTFITDPSDPKYDTRTDPDHKDFEGPTPIHVEGNGMIEIDRVHNITYEEFMWKYMATKTPVILKGMASEWPAVKKWSPDFFVKNFPKSKIKTEWGTRNHGKAKFITIDKFFSYMANNTDRVPMYGEFGTHQLGVNSGGLMEDLRIPAYFADDWFVLCTGYPHKKATARALYIGGKHSGIENHQDALSTFAYSVQIFGRKRWRLFPPYTEHNLADGKADTYRPQPEYVETLKGARPFYDFILEPGDVLFWYGPYYHQTYVIEDSMAISENFINYFNFDDFQKEMSWDCENDNLPKKFCKIYQHICMDVWQAKKKAGPYYTPCKRESEHHYCDLPTSTITKSSNVEGYGAVPDVVHNSLIAKLPKKKLKKLRKKANKMAQEFLKGWLPRHQMEVEDQKQFLRQQADAFLAANANVNNGETKTNTHQKDEL